jgi:peptidoglycan L-alanyl-D-glutamate endopeptidase CwlK
MATSTRINGVSVSLTRPIDEQRIKQLQPRIRLAAAMLVTHAASLGYRLIITQGLRTWREQDELYAQGRTAPGSVVTNARGGTSWHNFGLAFDVALLRDDGSVDYDIPEEVGRLGEGQGLEWGGRWRGFRDDAHFQSRRHLTIREARAKWPNGYIWGGQ